MEIQSVLVWKTVHVSNRSQATGYYFGKRGIPPLVAARLQRWVINLSAYSFDVQYRSTSQHGNAARFPITVEDEAGDLSESRVFNIHQN